MFPSVHWQYVQFAQTIANVRNAHPPQTHQPAPPVVISSPTAVVHLEYDPELLGPPPSGWTRFVCISDTHSRSFPVPPGDVLLHSGDLTNTGTYYEFEITMKWLYKLPHKVKIIIAGNHDLSLHRGWYDENFSRWNREKQDYASIMKLLQGDRAVNAGVVYLQDNSYEFQVKDGGRTWSVYGSPWSPYFFDWAFNYQRGSEADTLVSKFPKTDILLTHGPPFGILDKTRRSSKVGCKSLTAYLPTLRPRLHVFGHIHEAHGAEIHAWDTNFTPDLENNTLQSHSADNDEEFGFVLDGGEDDSVLLPGTIPNSEAAEDLGRTAFVNAANWPAGPRSIRDGERVAFAGRGFQPVVVDLKDDM